MLTSYSQDVQNRRQYNVAGQQSRISYRPSTLRADLHGPDDDSIGDTNSQTTSDERPRLESRSSTNSAGRARDSHRIPSREDAQGSSSTGSGALPMPPSAWRGPQPPNEQLSRSLDSASDSYGASFTTSSAFHTSSVEASHLQRTRLDNSYNAYGSTSSGQGSWNRRPSVTSGTSGGYLTTSAAYSQHPTFSSYGNLPTQASTFTNPMPGIEAISVASTNTATSAANNTAPSSSTNAIRRAPHQGLTEINPSLPDPNGIAPPLPVQDRDHFTSAHVPRLETVGDHSNIDYRGEAQHDSLTAGYKVHHSSYFIVGWVFLIPWPEPAGEPTNAAKASRKQDQRGLIPGIYNTKIHQHIVRMVVIQERHGYSHCLKISTYSGQGTKTKNLSLPAKRAHAVIHSSTQAVVHPLPEEKWLSKQPIAVNMAPGQTLKPESRINFGKIYTVEHNVKVEPVGQIARSSMPYFYSHFNNENKF
jgi:hypothetical protein